MLIQKLRLKQGWSQQQLAEASGLSVRTIQRLEAGKPASVESLKSLAAVFEVDFSTLNPEHAMNADNPSPGTIEEQEAFAHVRRLRGWSLHLGRYLLGIACLFALNLFLTPHRLWAVWVAAGWGLGLIIHGLRVFGMKNFLGPQWERRQVEKRLGRPL